MAKSILLGVAVVMATVTLSIIAEVIVFFVSSRATTPPGVEVGIDLVTIAKERLCTPTGLITGAVIFTLTILLSTRRGTQ